MPNDWTNSALATTRPLTLLNFVMLLGGDATNNDVVTIDDATCIGAYYELPFTDCGTPGSSPDVKVNGVVDIFDLVLMGSNYELTYSPGSSRNALKASRVLPGSSRTLPGRLCVSASP
ncbi:MAG: hypothetical protein HZY76_13075 [Anaerolineae bacterium]|nr:MAG: hypothetical protein HZY76_13075 [Anaerolineae bacterium]